MAAAPPGPLGLETKPPTAQPILSSSAGRAASTSSLTRPWGANGHQASSVRSTDLIIVRAGVTLPLVGPTSGSSRVLVPFDAAPSHPPRLFRHRPLLVLQLSSPRLGMHAVRQRWSWRRARDDLRWWGDRADVLLCVRRRTGGEREPVRVCVRTCSTGAAALFVQGFGAVRRQAGLAATHRAGGLRV